MPFTRNDLVHELVRLIKKRANAEELENWGFEHAFGEDRDLDPQEEELLKEILTHIANIDIHGKQNTLNALPYLLFALERVKSQKVIQRWLSLFFNVSEIRKLLEKKNNRVISQTDFNRAVTNKELDSKLLRLLIEDEGSIAWNKFYENLKNPKGLSRFLKEYYRSEE